MGIPTIATALGSFNDRIVHGQSGFLFKPNCNALLEIVRSLHADPRLLARVAERLSSQQMERSVEAMVDDYRTLIPILPRQVARFRVGIGKQTGLTEPYRQLSEAYAQVSVAYNQTNTAYMHTKSAYEQSQNQLAALTTLSDQFVEHYDALRVDRHWWRIPGALRVMRQLRRKIGAFKNEPNMDEATSQLPRTGKS